LIDYRDSPVKERSGWGILEGFLEEARLQFGVEGLYGGDK